MDTIGFNTMLKATDELLHTIAEHSLGAVHTVTIELNGQHGGADLTIMTDEVTIKRVIH